MGWITDPDHQLQCFLFAKKKTLQKLLFLEKHDKKKKRERERKLHCGDVCSMKLSGSSRQQRERERERRHTDGGSLRRRACTVRKSTHTASLYDVKSVSCSAHSRLDPHRVLYLHARGTRQPPLVVSVRNKHPKPSD